jgi:hypothetical protein
MNRYVPLLAAILVLTSYVPMVASQANDDSFARFVVVTVQDSDKDMMIPALLGAWADAIEKAGYGPLLNKDISSQTGFVSVPCAKLAVAWVSNTTVVFALDVDRTVVGNDAASSVTKMAGAVLMGIELYTEARGKIR